jgi:hypothetical protein
MVRSRICKINVNMRISRSRIQASGVARGTLRLRNDLILDVPELRVCGHRNPAKDVRPANPNSSGFEIEKPYS